MNMKSRVLTVGVVMGALLGGIAAYLYLRSLPLDDDGSTKLPSVHPGKAIAVGLSALTLLRQIVGLGQRG
jgi:hypothetical protein